METLSSKEPSSKVVLGRNKDGDFPVDVRVRIVAETGTGCSAYCVMPFVHSLRRVSASAGRPSDDLLSTQTRSRRAHSAHPLAAESRRAHRRTGTSMVSVTCWPSMRPGGPRPTPWPPRACTYSPRRHPGGTFRGESMASLRRSLASPWRCCLPASTRQSHSGTGLSERSRKRSSGRATFRLVVLRVSVSCSIADHYQPSVDVCSSPIMDIASIITFLTSACGRRRR
jgi:hypothetical protein